MVSTGNQKYLSKPSLPCLFYDHEQPKKLIGSMWKYLDRGNPLKSFGFYFFYLIITHRYYKKVSHRHQIISYYIDICTDILKNNIIQWYYHEI